MSNRYTHDYTEDELWSMTVGRDLDAAIAATFFGWRWMAYPGPNSGKMLAGLFPPGSPGRICVANQYDQIWQPSNRHAVRFSNWAEVDWWENGDHRVGFPHYSGSMTDAWPVVSLLREMLEDHEHGVPDLGAEFELPYCTSPLDEISALTDRPWPWAMLYVTPEIICKAALLEARMDE